MRPIRIFISSVQQEFANERRALAEYIRTDLLIDRQIILEEQKLEKLKRIETACLDKMFV